MPPSIVRGLAVGGGLAAAVGGALLLLPLGLPPLIGAALAAAGGVAAAAGGLFGAAAPSASTAGSVRREPSLHVDPGELARVKD